MLYSASGKAEDRSSMKMRKSDDKNNLVKERVDENSSKSENQGSSEN